MIIKQGDIVRISRDYVSWGNNGEIPAVKEGDVGIVTREKKQFDRTLFGVQVWLPKYQKFRGFEPCDLESLALE